MYGDGSIDGGVAATPGRSAVSCGRQPVTQGRPLARYRREDRPASGLVIIDYVVHADNGEL